MSELEPIPYGEPIMRELAHHQAQVEKAEQVMRYHQAKIAACVEILKSSNIIWVPDERWQHGNANSGEG